MISVGLFIFQSKGLWFSKRVKKGANETPVPSQLQSLAVLFDSKTQIPTKFVWDGYY